LSGAIEYLPSGTTEVTPESGGWTAEASTNNDTHDLCPWKTAIFTEDNQQPGSDIEEPMEDLG
jgi:hypothetical protein